MSTADQFWRSKPLAAMNPDEWEALCDGCARCCLIKLQDEDSDAIYYTNVACHQLNVSSCRCRDYANRRRKVPDCIVISPDDDATLGILPESCAYRRLHEGKALLSWHPLVSGSERSVHDSGMSVRGKVVSEEYIHPNQLEEHVVSWVKV